MSSAVAQLKDAQGVGGLHGNSASCHRAQRWQRWGTACSVRAMSMASAQHGWVIWRFCTPGSNKLPVQCPHEASI